jgi:hypothetical protein
LLCLPTCNIILPQFVELRGQDVVSLPRFQQPETNNKVELSTETRVIWPILKQDRDAKTCNQKAFIVEFTSFSCVRNLFRW